MTLTLDPYQERLLNWKLKQNIVLQIFLNAWWNASKEEREEIGYTIATINGKKVIRDPDNQIAAELAAHGNIFRVVWFRSFQDYEEIDRLGQMHTKRETVQIGTKVN